MFQDLYKQSIDISATGQEIRRREALCKQRARRTEAIDDTRRKQRLSSHEDRTIKKEQRISRSLRERIGWNISVQLAEWLHEKPDDLSQWDLVAYPKGQRCLVVAHGGWTDVYSKNDYRFTSVKTALPGGNTNDRKATTILDCVLVRDLQTFFVLDVLMFGKQNLVDCEAEFRYFLLRSILDENPTLATIDKRNEKKFCLLQRINLDDKSNVTAVLERYPVWPNNSPLLDGFLFLHKEASYTCGRTPLACWLFPFMFPHVLGLKVSPEYICPSNYTDPLKYMSDFDAIQARRKEKKNRNGHSESGVMEITDDLSSSLTSEPELEEMDMCQNTPLLFDDQLTLQ